jgi:hypothetical protein
VTAPLLCAALLPVLAAPAAVAELESHSEVRVRSPTSLDAEQLSTARLTLSMQRIRFDFSYAPLLTFTSLDSDPQIDVLNQGEIATEMEFRRVRVGLAERASYGTRSFAGLQGSTYDLVFSPTGTQIVPVADSVDYASSDTSLTVDWEISPHWGAGLTLGYLIDGGIDDRSRRVIPQVVGPRGTLEVDYGLTREDQLTAAIEAETLTTNTGSEGGIKFRTNIWRGLGRWGRSWDAHTSSDIGGGVAFVNVDPAPNGGFRVYPVLSASAQHLFLLGPGRQTLELGGNAELNVNVDRLTGLPDQRFSISAESTWSYRRYEVTAGAGASKSLPNSADINQVSVIDSFIAGRYALSQLVGFELGFRSAWQEVDNPTTQAIANAGAGFSWVTFGAVELRTPPLPL